VKHKHVIAAVIVTWLIVSFVPSLSAASLLGRRPGK
jgi:hypothetical protein